MGNFLGGSSPGGNFSVGVFLVGIFWERIFLELIRALKRKNVFEISAFHSGFSRSSQPLTPDL